MAISLITSWHFHDGGSRPAAVNSSGGTLAIVFVSVYSNPSITLSDSLGNTYTLVREQVNDFNNRLKLYECVSPIVGSGHDWTVTGDPAGITAMVFGGTTGSAENSTSSFDDSSTLTIQPGSISPGGADRLFVTGVFVFQGPTTAPTINSSFTVQENCINGSYTYRDHASGYKITSGSGSENPTWTTAEGYNKVAIMASYAPLLDSGKGNFFAFFREILEKRKKVIQGGRPCVVPA